MISRQFAHFIGQACAYAPIRPAFLPSICSLSTSALTCVAANIFDRNVKQLQKNHAAAHPDSSVFDYVKEEIGWRVADRVFDIKREFDTIFDLGAGKGYVFRHFDKEMVRRVVACEHSSLLDAASPPEGVELVRRREDEETVEIAENSADLVTSSLCLHWVNDLPGCIGRVFRGLKPDGAFIGAVLGGDTLYQLRCSLQLATMERDGGVSVHVSPFVQASDIGGLLTRAGFTMLTIDVDSLTVGYPSMFELMWDLQGMAENNAALNRSLRIRRETLLAAAAIYKEMYGSTSSSGDESVPATFEVLHFIAWKPGPNQPQPMPRGSGDVSLKDLGDIVKKAR